MAQFPSIYSLPRRTGRDLKRGAFARDNRTGAIVKVAEVGGRDLMVRPAYKSDGYWVAPELLTPCKDPHEATGWFVVRVLLALVIAGFAAFSAWTKMTGHGVGGDDAFWQAALPTGIVMDLALVQIFGLGRS